ncbi:MAG: glycine dehydrogenase, partial [Pseudomonadota bacterium]
NEFTLRLPKPAAEVVDALADKDILGGVPLTRIQPDGDPNLLLVAATETNDESDFAAFEAALTEVLS